MDCVYYFFIDLSNDLDAVNFLFKEKQNNLGEIIQTEKCWNRSTL